MLRFIAFLIFISLLSSMHAQSDDATLRKQADSLAQAVLITDGHVDLPYRLRVRNFQLTREYIGIPVETENGDFDYVRAKKGGLDAPFMSIYIPAAYQSEDGGPALALADSLIDMVEGIIEAHPDKFAPGRTPQEVTANFENGLISLPMGMENGAPIGNDLKNVQRWYDRGIRYITLTHSKDNQICDSSYDTTRTWNGLSPFGREVVAEMNRVGIMIDISHVSDSTFFQVMDLTEAPCIASHSSVRAFTPGFERNMNDEMIKRLAENDGVIQINFGSSFLDGALRARNDSLRNVLSAQLREAGLTFQDSSAAPIIEAFREQHPTLYSDVETVADHIDHVVKLVGVEHVGFGSDFDGVGDSLPTGLKDVSMYPNLLFTLLKRGYTVEDLEKICSGNVLRVWNKVAAVAGQ